MNKYLRIARFDHWIKQLFVLPGAVFACFFINDFNVSAEMIVSVIISLIATGFVASANYVINEWLDRDFDKFHPVKKNRPAVASGLNPAVVYTEYALLAVFGLALSLLCSKLVFITEAVLLIMGVVYNVKPIRSKDVPVLDVLTESINNALRLLIGWFAVTSVILPPSSIVLGYWMGGAFLMTVKRLAEYRMIGNPETAGLYRKSFAKYNSRSLLTMSLFFAMLSVFFIGVFLLKYRMEFLIAIPFLCGLFCYYLSLAFKEDSAAQKPEKLFREKWLMLYVAFIVLLLLALLFIDIPALQMFSEPYLIELQ